MQKPALACIIQKLFEVTYKHKLGTVEITKSHKFQVSSWDTVAAPYIMLYYSLNYSGRRYQNVASQMKPHGTYEMVTTHHNEVQILILLIFWLLPTFPNFEGKSQSTMTEAENKIH